MTPTYPKIRLKPGVHLRNRRNKPIYWCFFLKRLVVVIFSKGFVSVLVVGRGALVETCCNHMSTARIARF